MVPRELLGLAAFSSPGLNLLDSTWGSMRTFASNGYLSAVMNFTGSDHSA